jgi:integrase
MDSWLANPAARLGKLPRAREEIRKQADPLTAEELSSVLAACRDWATKLGKADTRRWFFPFILTLARTGMRLGEAVGLQWGDLDFNNRSVLIERNFTGGRMTTPKSGKARVVEMSAGLADVLKAELGKARDRAVEKGARDLEPTAWVFTDRDGVAMLDSDNFRRNVWAPLLRKLGLRHRRIHDLRHTFAVLHLQDGRSPVWVKDQLGHSSIQITVDVYGKWIPTSDRSSADRLDAIAPPIADAPGRTPRAPKDENQDTGDGEDLVSTRKIDGGAWTRTTDLGIMRPSL